MLFRLCESALERPIDTCFFGSLPMYDASQSVKITELQALDKNTKYLFTWQDCDATDASMLEQLHMDTRDFLREVFRFTDDQLDACTMCFHTTTAVRNPRFHSGNNRGQYLHLHLQVYASGYVPSMSCMQRSIRLQELIMRLRECKTGRHFPHTYYDETLVDHNSHKFLRSMLTSTDRFFPEDAVLGRNTLLDLSLTTMVLQSSLHLGHTQM